MESNSCTPRAVHDAAVAKQSDRFRADTLLSDDGADTSDPPATPAPHTVRASQPLAFGVSMVLCSCSSCKACTPATCGFCLPNGKLPCHQPSDVLYYEGGGHRYYSGDGFSEMLLFEGLRTLRLRLEDPPHRLYFADGFSKLTQLNVVELHEDCKAQYNSDTPTFSASAFSITTALALLRLKNVFTYF